MDADGLMFYGARITEMFRGVPVYVDRILKGAKPAELPLKPVGFAESKMRAV